MAERLHEVLGLVSAIAYVLSAFAVFISFVIFQFHAIPILVAIHTAAVLIAIMATCGMLCWWLVEQEPIKRLRALR